MFSLEEQSSDCSQQHPFVKYPSAVGLCAPERWQSNCLPEGVILVSPTAMEIFLKIKPNFKPNLLQFMNTVTSMDLVWKKLRRVYDTSEKARWNLSFPGAKFAAGIQDKDWNWSASYSSYQGRDTEPILLSLLKGNACCAEQEFHCWPQKLGHVFPSKCIFHFCIKIVLQLTVFWHFNCVPLNLWDWVLSRSSAHVSCTS